MTLPQSILTAVFCMIVVFVVLIALWGIIRLFSVFITMVEKNQLAVSDQNKQ